MIPIPALMQSLLRILPLALLLGAAPLPAPAHPGHEGEGGNTGSFVFSSFAAATQVTTAASSASQVTINTSGGVRTIKSNGIPNHQPGQFPNRNNPGTIAPQAHEFRTTTSPAPGSQLTPARGAWFGVAVNGVPFEPGTAEFWNGDRSWVYEALGGFINLGLDQSNAHVQPSGAYHYHATPTGLLSSLGGDTKTMRLIGWAADGYPIYTSKAHASAMDADSPLREMKSSYQLKKASRAGGPGGTPDGRFAQDFEFVSGSGDLDASNGRTGVTPEFPQGTYYYCVTDEFPWISRYWRGTPDTSFFKQRGPGPGGAPGQRQGQGQGPPPGAGLGPLPGPGGPRRGPPPPPPLGGPPPPFGPLLPF